MTPLLQLVLPSHRANILNFCSYLSTSGKSLKLRRGNANELSTKAAGLHEPPPWHLAQRGHLSERLGSYVGALPQTMAADFTGGACFDKIPGCQTCVANAVPWNLLNTALCEREQHAVPKSTAGA